MKLRILTLSMVYTNQITIQWELEDPSTDARANEVLYSVDYSGSANGPWEEIANGLDSFIYTHTFSDSSGDLVERSILDPRKELWMRVRAYISGALILTSAPMDDMGHVPIEVVQQDPVGLLGEHYQISPGPQTVFTRSPARDRRLVLAQRLVTRRSLIALHRFNGSQLVLYKRRTCGARCTYCYDHVTKETTISDCPECYGTSFSGGYYTPVMFLGKLDEDPTVAAVAPEGQIKITRAIVQTVEYPRIEQRDLIYVVDSGRYWEVTNPMQALGLRQRRITQTVAISELPPTSTAYSLDASTTGFAANIYGSLFESPGDTYG